MTIPTETILHAENASSADHIMPNFWVNPADTADVAAQPHSGRANYNFVDGHAQARRFAETWNRAGSVDVWNPSRAQ